jgi:hypothetical protein
MTEKEDAEAELTKAKEQAAEQVRVSMARIGELLKVADDKNADPTERVLAGVKALMVQIGANARKESLGDTFGAIIEKATPRLEAFGGNIQEMGHQVHETMARVSRLENNLAELMRKQGLSYKA